MENRDLRVFIPPHPAHWDGNIRELHPADTCAWVWAEPRSHCHETRFLRFTLDFESTAAAETLRFHVTGDQRFQLSIDGRSITYGPDRSDLDHWPVTTCELGITAGRHRIEALVWYIEDVPVTRPADNTPETAGPPMAQISWRGGFMFCGDGPWAGKLDTGKSAWQVQDLTGAVKLSRKTRLAYHDIGPSFDFDIARWTEGQAAGAPLVIRPGIRGNPHGVRRPGWILYPATLPEQQRGVFTSGVIRAVRADWSEGQITAAETGSAAIPEWAELLAGRPLTVAPNSELTVIWDFQSYVCGYPHLAWSAGKGARIEVEFAESLYNGEHSSKVDAGNSPKGQRDAVEGKVWLGFGDAFTAGGGEERSPGLWWRSGRYVRLRVRTGAEALELRRLAVLSTIYPLKADIEWTSSDKDWDDILPLLQRGLEAGAHETWTDSPYYEQMMYVGDTALHTLSNYACYRDDRVTRRALELFGWSRRGSLAGMVAERYPSGWRQESATYSMIWAWMLRDFVMWRRDEAFAREQLIGVRQMMETFLQLRDSDGLLGVVPGWPFVDWTDQWDQGCGPGVREGDSSLVNLHFVLALQATAICERGVGEAEMAVRYDSYAQQVMTALLARYWHAGENALADTRGIAPSSEHAQALALLTGLLSEDQRKGCRAALTSGRLPVKCSIYFAHYLLDSYYQAGDAESFFERLEFWRGLRPQGFVALPEMPEPSRSDCHGWGAHPLYHSFATIAGIRPAAPGFRKVRIAPMPGPLQHAELAMPHPDGEIRMSLQRDGDALKVNVRLPQGVDGVLAWRGTEQPFSSSISTTLPA